MMLWPIIIQTLNTKKNCKRRASELSHHDIVEKNATIHFEVCWSLHVESAIKYISDFKDKCNFRLDVGKGDLYLLNTGQKWYK